MEDLFLQQTSNLDKLLDEFEEREAPAVKQSNKTNKTSRSHNISVAAQSTSTSNDTINPTLNANNVDELLSSDIRSNVARDDLASHMQQQQQNTADAFSENNLLIDLSAPNIPAAENVAPAYSLLTDLDFLLAELPQDNQLDNIKGEPSGEYFSINTVANKAHEQAAGDTVPIFTKADSTDYFGPLIITTPNVVQPKTLLHGNLSQSTSSALVGFDDIQVDNSEFDKFMEESNQAEDVRESQRDVTSANVEHINVAENNVDNELISSVNAGNDEVVLEEENTTCGQPVTNSDVGNTIVETDPKLKKLFQNGEMSTHNTVSSSTVVGEETLSSSLIANSNSHSDDSRGMQNREVLENIATVPTVSAIVDRPNHQEDSVTSSHVVAQSIESSNVVAQSIESSNAQSSSSHSNALDDQLTSEYLPDRSTGTEVQRVPNVSPPSYSSVIAGEYSAGTIIQESHSFAPPVAMSDPQHMDDVIVEQAVEATEDISHINLNAAEHPHSLDPRQRLAANPAMLQRPGEVKPRWMPDEETSICTKCNVKFTFTRRRHHCRACGQIFCSSCCSEKSQLAFLNFAEARVCISCFSKIVQADAAARMQSGTVPSTVLTAPISTPSVPISVMRTDNGASGGTPKSVRFSDGTKPDHPDVLPATPPPPPVRNPRSSRSSNRSGNIPQTLLPPLIKEYSEDGSYSVDDDPDVNLVLILLKTSENNYITFALGANLFVLVKIVQYSCSSFYYFISSGLDSVGHSEVALLLEVRDSEDNSFPMQAFSLYSHLFNAARKGKAVQANDFLPIEDFTNHSENLFGSNDYAGLIFVRRTVQDIQSLLIDHTGERSFLACPTVLFSSTLYALLVRKSEVPWAKLFYSRLLFGLGAKYKQYPYPLVNYHDRPPVCFEVANTILGILCDFRNYKYKVVTVPGLSVVTTREGVVVNIPYNRFVDVMKIINSSNEHVVALGSNTFLSDADCQSHLVCLQDESKRTYHTQVLSHSGFQNENDGHVGAAFIVFNGSLKSGSTQQARCSIVEDGVMVQLLPEKMSTLKEALKAVEDFRISCNHPSPVKHVVEGTDHDANAASSSIVGENIPQHLEVRWVADDTKFNIGISSPIDFRSFEGVVGYNVQGKSEKKGKNQVLRWNQVFFFKTTSDILDMSRLAEQVANGCFQSLLPHVKLLRDNHQTKIGVRVNIHPDDVGYAVGSRGLPLPGSCLNALDDGLIPLTHEASSSLHVEDDPVVFELIFSVLDIRPSWKVVTK